MRHGREPRSPRGARHPATPETFAIVDRVEWSAGRTFPLPSGASITLGFPTANNELGTKRCASSSRWDGGDFGNPGAVGRCETPPAPPAIFVSEVLRNPAATGDSNGEWFEVYNAGDAGIKVVPVGVWTNGHNGTASSNGSTCAPASSTTVPTTTTPTTPTTTPAPPAPTTTIPPTTNGSLTAGYGVLSVGGVTCGNGLQLSGSNVRVAGGVRSNGNVMVQGSSVDIVGAISYAGSQNVGNKVTSLGIAQSAGHIRSGLSVTSTDLLPGGKLAAGTSLHVGDWNVQSAAAGIHTVVGNVTVSSSSVDLRGVTIVATGTVTISGSNVQLSPAIDGLPAVLAGGGSCTGTAINVSGSSTTWSGVLAAPLGMVQVNGSNVRGGTVLGASVQISGSDIQLG